jgi:hypothetical protein
MVDMVHDHTGSFIGSLYDLTGPSRIAALLIVGLAFWERQTARRPAAFDSLIRSVSNLTPRSKSWIEADA